MAKKLKRYKVTLERNGSFVDTAEVTVDAEDPDSAEREALTQVIGNRFARWERLETTHDDATVVEVIKEKT